MTDLTSNDPARNVLSVRGIVLATLGAAAVAFALLIAVVAPAEYGYDPTGLGKRLGMDRLFTASHSASVLWRADGARRSDTATVVIPAGEGVEVKAEMVAGQQLLYSWASEGGPVFLEIHGDPTGGDPYSSYETLLSIQSGEGGLTAPFDGSHGWYFRNDNATDVTVVVETEGYYQLLGAK